ncbi:regulatory protein [Agromyces ramosus]|jgi:regulatory protein|uniref:Regulatory protein RecX n=1 Tax=Agromyces ramosus TaxID=33879 RepID=A0A4Q7MIM0_9MICO|nr:regulatory protein RecX [Agromyces ramosus]RZS67627.1 regulatory protein [Agromyces ramosus]
MSDASEHLAPVSYLPWATPAEPAPEQSAPADPARATEAAEGAEPDAEPRRAEATPAGRSRFGDPSGAARRAERRRSRFAIVADDPDETGAERDARIDRLVVSRLRRSALSVAEVRSVLAEHGLDESEIEEWIERYERFGYLDDARLAEQLVHVNGARRGRGSGAILQELSRRGVDASAARAAVDELDPEVERRNALEVAERRVRQLSGLDRQTAERRLSAFLQRRGYPGDVVREAVTAALSADGS